jgi:Rieske Fe-S protein
MLRFSPRAAITVIAFLGTACDTGAKNTQPTSVTAEPKAPAASAPTPAPAPAAAEGALRLGAPIEASAQKVALADVAKTPNAFVGKTFATTGTVTAVCQHMGCWMEIKDDASEAHIKMAGHAFFVPKTASGRKARVLAKLVKAEESGSCEGEGHDKMAAASGAAAGEKGAPAKGKGCRAEAEEQLGRPLAKLELVADGVELM